MHRTVCLFLCAAAVLALAGCPAPGVSPYPRSLGDIGDSADYPLRAAGFERAKILGYAPDNADVSVGYNMLTPEAQIASTIYISASSVFPEVRQAENPLAALFELNKAGVRQYHPGASLLGEDSVVLVKNGREYHALRAVFRYEDGFMGRRQQLYSLLMLWRHDDDFIKLRSTTLYAQRHLSESNNLNLLQAVNWTARPH